MKYFYIKTLGCKTNQIESDLISENLQKHGYISCESLSDADIFILNSCSVTSNADNEALKILKRARRENKDLYVILTGCFAELEGESLESADFVNLVLGNSEKMNISDYIDKEFKINVSGVFNQKEFLFKKVQNPTKTRAFLKVQDGCNNRCSYCTIWKARGKSRSCLPEQVKEQISSYIGHGFDEIVLTGIHIGQWGADLIPRLSFIDLIKILENSDIKRYRLGSLDPLELTDELIDFLSKSNKFCPHFHISLQSACDKTLKAMNRHYTAEYFLDRVKLINEKFLNPFIGSDVIVGFPGETDEDFSVTCENIEFSGLTMAHIFPYSIRKNTVAAEMDNQVSKHVKSERLSKLKAIVDKKFEAFCKNNTGTIQSVIFEKNKCEKSGMYKGLTANYLTVYAESKTDVGGKMLNCKILESRGGLLICEPL